MTLEKGLFQVRSNVEISLGKSVQSAGKVREQAFRICLLQDAEGANDGEVSTDRGPPTRLSSMTR